MVDEFYKLPTHYRSSLEYVRLLRRAQKNVIQGESCLPRLYDSLYLSFERFLATQGAQGMEGCFAYEPDTAEVLASIFGFNDSPGIVERFIQDSLSVGTLVKREINGTEYICSTRAEALAKEAIEHSEKARYGGFKRWDNQKQKENSSFPEKPVEGSTKAKKPEKDSDLLDLETVLSFARDRMKSGDCDFLTRNFCTSWFLRKGRTMKLTDDWQKDLYNSYYK